MKKLILFAIAGIILSACSNSGSKAPASQQEAQKQIVISNDMENAYAGVPSWGFENGVISMKNPAAHSGTFACMTNDTLEYSYSYRELFKNINNGLPKSVFISGWLYSTVPNPNFSIIMDLTEAQKMYDWKSYPLQESIKEPGRWVEFSASFYFDKPLKAEQLIRIFAWNQSKKAVYLDDLKLVFNY